MQEFSELPVNYCNLPTANDDNHGLSSLMSVRLSKKSSLLFTYYKPNKDTKGVVKSKSPYTDVQWVFLKDLPTDHFSSRKSSSLWDLSSNPSSASSHHVKKSSSLPDIHLSHKFSCSSPAESYKSRTDQSIVSLPAVTTSFITATKSVVKRLATEVMPLFKSLACVKSLQSKIREISETLTSTKDEEFLRHKIDMNLKDLKYKINIHKTSNPDNDNNLKWEAGYKSLKTCAEAYFKVIDDLGLDLSSYIEKEVNVFSDFTSLIAKASVSHYNDFGWDVDC